MSGLEVVGAIASVAQLFDLGIRASQIVINFYDSVKSGQQKTAGRLQIVQELQRLLTELRSDKELDTAPLEASIKPIINRLLQLEHILQKLLQSNTRKFGTYLGPVQNSINEKRIQHIFDELERDKTTFLIHFAVQNTRYQQRFQSKLLKMPSLAGQSLSDSHDESRSEIVLSNLPATHVPRFIGQKLQLSLMKAAYETANDAEHVVIVTGTAGSGKSQLALDFARARWREGASIYWIDSSSQEQLRRSFLIVSSNIYAKKLRNYPCADPEHSVEYVKDFLITAKTPWIMIFDNWDQPETLPNLFSLIPSSHSGFVLVTSRHPDVARLGTNIELKGMTKDDALDLLITRIGSDSQQNSKSTGLAIVERLGHLPLAVDQAASYIRSVGVPMQQFLQHYEDQKLQVLRHVPAVWEYRRLIQGKEEPEVAGVFTTWELVFVSFATKRSVIAQFMDLLGFFDRSSIDEALFQTFVDVHKDDVSIPEHMPAAKAVYNVLNQFRAADGAWNTSAFREALILLKNERLVEGTLFSSMGTLKLSLHPLVSDWLKVRQNKDMSTSLFAKTCTILRCMIKAKEDDIDCSLEVWQELLTHVDNLLLHWGKTTMSPGEELHEALLAFCKLYFLRGRYNSAVENYQKLLTSLNTAGQQDNLQKYEALRGLARAYHTLGKYDEAERAIHDSIDGFRNCLGEDALQTAASKERLANLLRSRADYDSAEKIYLEVITCRKAALGELHKKTLLSIANLGVLYKSQKKFDEAQAIYDKLAVDLWGSGKEMDFSLIWIKNDYATLLQNRGRSEEAQTMYEEVLLSRQKQLGPDHHDTLWTSADLAANLKSQQKYTEAKEIYEETVVRLKDQLGETHSETLWTASGLGDLYAQMGNLGEAERLLVWVLQCRTKLLGNNHPNTIQTLDHLANVYSLQSRLDGLSTLTEETILEKPPGTSEAEHRRMGVSTNGSVTASGGAGFMKSLALSCYCGRGRTSSNRKKAGR